MAADLYPAGVRVRLDWSDDAHWSPTPADCRRCGTRTHGRDEQGRPIHQSCAEEELAAEVYGQLRGPAVVDERTSLSGGYRTPRTAGGSR